VVGAAVGATVGAVVGAAVGSGVAPQAVIIMITTSSRLVTLNHLFISLLPRIAGPLALRQNGFHPGQ
jgi:uncharacterized spore protein YtfJ